MPKDELARTNKPEAKPAPVKRAKVARKVTAKKATAKKAKVTPISKAA
jgi:hypothetical protein